MNKIQKVSIITAFLLVVSLLCSCSSVGIKQVTYNGRQPIPENGTLTAQTLERIKNDSSVSEFYGNCDEFEYTWYIFGTEITEIRDINLLLTIKKTDMGYSVSFCSQEDFGFKCYLSVSIPDKFENSTFSVISEENNLITSTEISVAQDKTIIKFSPVHQYGSLLLSPTVEQETEIRAEVTTTEEELPVSETETIVTTTQETTTGTVSVTTTTINSTTSAATISPATTATQTTAVHTTVPTTTSQVDTCIISIECSTIFSNLSLLEANKLSQLPADGVILKKTEVSITDDTVFSVLQRVCRENGIHLEYSSSDAFKSVYIEGIHNLYEFDCGELSGWMYRVNGWYPNYGCSNYSVKNGDVIEFRYTCDLGEDIGGGF